MVVGLGQVAGPQAFAHIGSNGPCVVELGTRGVALGVRALQTPPGFTHTGGQAQTEINSRMSTLCTTIKNRGILIYTVVLDTSGGTTNEATRTLYQGCASAADTYFFVSAADQLRPAFQTIATQLANLRLSQ